MPGSLPGLALASHVMVSGSQLSSVAKQLLSQVPHDFALPKSMSAPLSIFPSQSLSRPSHFSMPPFDCTQVAVPPVPPQSNTQPPPPPAPAMLLAPVPPLPVVTVAPPSPEHFAKQ